MEGNSLTFHPGTFFAPFEQVCWPTFPGYPIATQGLAFFLQALEGEPCKAQVPVQSGCILLD